jgi:hypothetical protein
MNFYIDSTDQLTVNIQQETATQDANFNYVSGSPTALQSSVVVDIQPAQATLSESATGGAYQSSHVMYSHRYANVLTAYPSGGVVVVSGGTTYDVQGIKDWTTHMVADLQERI